MAPIHRLVQVSAHLLGQPALFRSQTSILSTHLIRNYTSSSSSSSNDNSPYKVTNKDRAFYPYALDIQSRWSDNDQYGHVNNAHYYAYFDTVINTFLIQEAGLDPHDHNQGNAVGVVAESNCKYFSSLSFPDMIEARLAVIKLGRSSVTYQVGIFKKLIPADESIQTTAGSLPISAGVFSRAAGLVSRDQVAEEETRRVFHSSQIQADVAATGHFCHVFVDKVSRRPVPIPDKIRASLGLLQVSP
ncbi:hypothetical protein BG011_007040 [Mortierella polycephala]|uniref:Thioesterase domain-containing protein n=1 Tax=Mortierella polycephala TaxID=41804 RepID=A0A9P6TZ57_9FUNG|nr:hypothetical protein BG011_007040 [Mortierella polycephala]